MTMRHSMLVRGTTVLAAGLLGVSDASAQIGTRDVSGIRVSIATAAATMQGRFHGSEPHIYQSQNRWNTGPGGALLALFDWKNVGLHLEFGGTAHEFARKSAFALDVRFGARFHPGFTILGFAPWLDASLFASPIIAQMDKSQVPAEVGPGVPSDPDVHYEEGWAQQTVAGHSFGIWLEREIGRGFSFWTRFGSDVGEVKDMRVEDTSYPAGGSPRWTAQRISVGVQYAFWPLR
jgi:hypothetical protein